MAEHADVFVITKVGKYNSKYFKMAMRKGVGVWTENPNMAATFNTYDRALSVTKEWGLRVYKISPMRIYKQVSKVKNHPVEEGG